MPTAIALLHQYPEVDLVNYSDDHNRQRRIPYLSPLVYTPEFEFDDDFLRVALAHAKRKGWNPIQYEIAGVNPLDIDINDIEGSTALIPNPEKVPPLEVFPPPSSITVMERINERGNTPMYTARVTSEWRNIPISNSEVVLLKIFRDVAFDMSKENDTTPRFYDHGLSRRLFEAEKAAYERLIHHGVVAAGVVPACYGWFPVTSDIPGVSTSPLQFLLDVAQEEDDQGPPRALVFEFIPDAERVSIHSASTRLAKDALSALQRVHRAFVLHRDINYRNVLVKKLPSFEDVDLYQVYIVDFDAAVLADGTDKPHNPFTANRATLMMELGDMWELFFRYLLPNQVIGWDMTRPRD